MHEKLPTSELAATCSVPICPDIPQLSCLLYMFFKVVAGVLFCVTASFRTLFFWHSDKLQCCSPQIILVDGPGNSHPVRSPSNGDRTAENGCWDATLFTYQYAGKVVFPTYAGDYELEPGGRDSVHTITPAAYAREAKAWIETGATIIGGCCATGP